VTVTVGSLYLTTHSIAVTAIGASAATAISAWTAWLGRTRAPGHPASGGAAREVPRADPPPLPPPAGIDPFD